MKHWRTIAAGIAAVALLTVPALAQQTQPKAADCQAKAPKKVDGQVTNVDPNANKITVKDKSGTTHEFQTNKETLQTMKPGDKIEATLRQAPNC